MKAIILKNIIDMIRKNFVKGNNFLTLLFACLLLTSCEKVIDIDLNSATPATVIEGSITDQPGPHTIKITKTVNYNQPNSFPAVTGATVTLSDNIGGTENLTETSPGIYESTTLAGVPGREYTLKVVEGSKTFSATSTMNAPVAIDTVIMEMNIFQPTAKIPNVKFYDPAGVKNFYRAIEIVNGDTIKTIFLMNDQLQDGDLLSFFLFDDSIEIKTGDNVEIILQSIDENVYNYFQALLLLIQEGGSSASPTNPPTNFGTSALGYFSAHSVTHKILVVPATP